MKKVLAALAAAAAGFAAGILTAPKSGRETREDIKKKAQELKDQADDAGAKARKKIDGLKTKLSRDEKN